jgi:hypothetical protein
MVWGTLALLVAAQGEPFELKDGDRVVMLGNTFVEREAQYGHVEAALTRRFPGRAFSFRNLGWSGDAVDLRLRPNGFPALENWLGDLKPTVIIAAYGMNESFAGEKGLPAFERGLREHLEALSKTKARIVLLSPIRHENLGPPLPDPAAHNRDLALYVEVMRKVAADRGARFVDLFAVRAETENGIHLSHRGYATIAAEIEKALGIAPPDSPIELKPGKPADVTDGYGRIVRAKGLAAGRWTLRIGGKPAASAAAEEWSAGIRIWRSERREEMLRKIASKNEVFFFRWRPQNMEYIYGTRSRAEGANVGNPQFASEFRQLEDLAARFQEEILALAVPAPESYELVRE